MRRGRLRSTAWPSARPTAERSTRFTDRRVRGPSAGTCAAAGDGVAAVRPPCRLRARARSRALASHASIQQAPSGAGGSQPSSGCRHRGQPILRGRRPRLLRRLRSTKWRHAPHFGCKLQCPGTVYQYCSVGRCLIAPPSGNARVSSEGPDMCQEKTAQPNRLAWRSAVTRDGQRHTDSTASL